MRLARVRPIAYEDAEQILLGLAFAGKKYCELVEKIMKRSPPITAIPSCDGGYKPVLPPEIRLSLQVQGTEILMSACSNLDMKVVFAANQLIIERFDIVFDTCHFMHAVNWERRIMQCLFRQVNAAFCPQGPLGRMLYDGYAMWHRLRSRLMRNLTKKDRNLHHSNPAVRVLLRMCHDNTTTCAGFETAKARMQSMGIERVSIETNSLIHIARSPVSAPHKWHRIMLVAEDA